VHEVYRGPDKRFAPCLRLPVVTQESRLSKLFKHKYTKKLRWGSEIDVIGTIDRYYRRTLDVDGLYVRANRGLRRSMGRVHSDLFSQLEFQLMVVQPEGPRR
jgi:hypothetical protein